MAVVVLGPVQSALQQRERDEFLARPRLVVNDVASFFDQAVQLSLQLPSRTRIREEFALYLDAYLTPDQFPAVMTNEAAAYVFPTVADGYAMSPIAGDGGIYTAIRDTLAFDNKSIAETEELSHIVDERTAELQTLLGEVHHRVKNDIMLMSSFLALKENRVESSEAKEALREAGWAASGAIKTDIDDVTVHRKTAVLLGIIVNELLTNALKQTP